tara:strand:- start:19743 stop:20816 length:1074 start_codon:yes stop_codon:yes gene_type:complete
MATTKVGGSLVDLNETNVDTVFQMPVGSSSFTGTPVAGMIRNNSSITNNSAATTFEFYNGTSWVRMNTETIPFVSYLVIAGGGSGGTGYGSGGGGGGGYRNSYASETSGGGEPTEQMLAFSSGTQYTITVGAGGARRPTGSSSHARGNQGISSSISGSDITTIESIGGGAAGGFNLSGTGGSGGGGGYYGAGGAAVTNPVTHGYAGESGDSARGGGGGGAGETGGTNGGGHGGDGASSSITGSAVTRAGGAGATVAGGNSSTGFPGGAGGGADGLGSYFIIGATPGNDGTANTGGGGSGQNAHASHNNAVGGAGGSGIVILRMPTSEYSGTTTGSPTVTTDGSDTILTYTGSGTYTH